ncbi:hypothetical protein [Salmonirosea aquatica]|uniref:Uncharacterized protein n=1 Tax=Salmonirosea aquatica TaxID=2654236 RepID=A0A7C9FR22_9BACT|nr:hypothetical protein [Cytophagaceae bacterium SJW1-29]
MIKSYDDLKAQRALAHNDLQLAKSQLTADTEAWKQEAKPLRLVSSIAGNLLTNRMVGKGKKGLIGNGLQLGLNAVLATTALRSLPTPLNMILPQVIENAALNYTKKNGRDWLIKGLRWVKKVTDETPEPEKTGILEQSETAIAYLPAHEPELPNISEGDQLPPSI